MNGNEAIIEFDNFDTKFLNLREKIELSLFLHAIRRATVITCPGKNLANHILRLEPRIKIEVIYNGTVSHFGEITPLRKWDVIAVSRLVKWKNLDILIKAAATLKLKLALVGDGPMRQDLEELAIRHQATVDFLGSQEPESVLDFIRQSGVYCLISSYEGQSFSLLEAMSLGKPIIVSAVPGNLETVSTYESKIVEVGNIQDTVAKLKQTFSDENEMRSLGIKAKLKHDEQFTIHKNLTSMISLILASAR